MVLAAMTAGCSSSAVAPVSSRGETAHARVVAPSPPARESAHPPAEHVVVSGDTLYGIAWRYGFDYRDIARWNGVKSPFVIRPGQRLKLIPPPADVQPADGPTAAKNSTRPSGAEVGKTPGATTVTGALRWQWPTPGTLVSLDTPSSRKGIDIAGRQGQDVKAAAAGEVVYSGSGLLGYGRLIIIKHSDTYLSAYAYNEHLLVKEGDKVGIGQQIATMGKAASGKTVLHFEIRKDGKPVNPLDYLPRRSS